MTNFEKNIIMLNNELEKYKDSDFNIIMQYKKLITNSILSSFLNKIKKMDIKSTKPYYFTDSIRFGTIKINEYIDIDLLFITKNKHKKPDFSMLSFAIKAGNKMFLLTPNKKKIEVISYYEKQRHHILYDEGIIKILMSTKKDWVEIGTYNRQKNIVTLIKNTNDFINTKFYKNKQEIGIGISDTVMTKNSFYSHRSITQKLFYKNEVVKTIKYKISNDLNISQSRIVNFNKFLNDRLEKDYKFGESMPTKSILETKEDIENFVDIIELKYAY